MALDIILTCLVLVSALNVALIYDLYGRSARLALYVESARRSINKILHLTSESNS
jgi:hypothetical protein